MSLRDLARGLTGRGGRPLTVWHHGAFRLPFPSSSSHGMDPRRAESVLTWLLDRRIVRDLDVREAPEASWADLRRVHDDGWLARVDEDGTVAHLMGLPVDEVPVASIVELWRRGVGAAVEAARHLRDHGGVAATLMGGFHHAHPDRGAGFCALNDLAVAIGVLRAEGLRGTVLIVDLDAHPPDGIAAFGLPDVDLRSVSGASGWDAGPGVRDVRVPLGASDEVYLAAVDEVLADLGDPVLAVYLAGSDPLAGDPFGALGVSEAGLRERDRRVFEAFGDRPTLVVPGGGYLPGSWRVLAGTLAQAAGRSTGVAPDYDPVARRVGRVARTFAPFEDDGPLITEEDLGIAFGGRRERRFLGHYTRHGLELAFARYGMFDALRRMGFRDPRVTIDVSGSPERLRILADADGVTHAVAEVSLAIRPVGSWRTLFIEWLELQDPRRQAAARSVLPGQQRPGLGLAREVGSMLTVAAERLHLAGISFVPSHFHVAWMARDRAVFADPVERGRFRALVRYLADVPLHRASQRLAGPGVPTEDGAALTWTPSIMVHALDPALREHLDAGEPEARAVERGTLERLLPVDVVFPRP